MLHLYILYETHPKSNKDLLFFFRLTVFQPLLGAVIWLFSMFTRTTQDFGRLGKPAMALLNKVAVCASASNVALKGALTTKAPLKTTLHAEAHNLMRGFVG